MFGSGLTIVILALIFGGFYYWARRQGLLATEQAAEEQSDRRISLLTEAVAYVGAILLLAGGIAAVSQRWNSLGDWGQVGVLAGAAAFFLLVGILLRRVREPAIQRLVGVVWFLSAACVGGAAGSAADDVSATKARRASGSSWSGMHGFRRVAKSRPLGIGLLVKDNVAVEEEVLEQTYEGRPYEYPLVRVFEIGDDGKIRRLPAAMCPHCAQLR
jgi:hypothetical protein